MVKIGKRAVRHIREDRCSIGNECVPKEMRGSTHLVADHETPLATTLDLEDFHDRTITAFDLPHYLLVDLERVFGSLFEEYRIRDGSDIGSSISTGRWGRLSREMALGHEVTTELLRGSRGDGTR
jgi:hypothetical protein